MPWGSLILLLVGGFAVGSSFYLTRRTGRLKFMALFWASVVFFFIEISQILDIVLTTNLSEFITAQIVEWGHVYCITLVLGALLLFIRESKPEFSRFPRFYAALPVILILSYLLVYDTIVLKKWLLNITEAGAVVVAVIIYGMYSYYEEIYKTIFIGASLFMLTYLLELFLPSSLHIIWQIFLAASIGTTFTGYLLAEKYYDYKTP